jgi:RNA recognition motif-containing protein
LIQDQNTRLNKGYGFVKFTNPEEAQRAIREMNGQIFRGRMIKVATSYMKN